MARTARKRSESDVYHIMMRGEGRRIIFEDEEDRLVLLRMLSKALDDNGATAYAWCLMSNHVHLLIKVDFERLSAVMKSLGGGYATYYNKKHDHVGHVFGGRYKSKPVETDEYLLQVVRYIHLNPVEDGLSRTCMYKWSSYCDYLNGTGFIDSGRVLDICGGQSQFRSFHEGMAAEKAARPVTLRTRLSDAEARALAIEVLGEDGLATLASCSKVERNDGIAALRHVGLSARQIERFTGIGRGIVSRVPWR